jgi:carboxylesterase
MSPAYLEGGEPFTLGEGGSGVLALHGFTGSPFEVRALGELLYQNGFSVFAPALAGHATTEVDLDGISADDYITSAEEAYQTAARRCDRLYVVGLSMGGTLGLHLATRQSLHGLVTISTPVFLYPMVNASVPVIEQWMPGLRTPANFAAWQGNVVGYKSTSIGAVRVVVDVLDRVRPELERVDSPVLVLHSSRDFTVPIASARTIHDSIRSKIKRLEIIDAGSHLMTVEPNLSLIGSIIVDFLRSLDG